MKSRFSTRTDRSTVAILCLSLMAPAAYADPAIVMGKSICDNQADSFDYQWITANVADTTLFFLSGDTAENGAINAVGHANAFNASDDVYIVVHGNVNIVDAFSGTDFATLFHNNHATPPDSVTFYVCQAGTPGGGVSSMASLARIYPGEAVNSTLIGAVNAPGPDTCPALAVNAAEQPFDPIENLSDAVYRTDVDHTDTHDALLNDLVTAWGNAATTPYPDTEQSYGAYCEAQLALDPAGAWVPAFMANVDNQFADDYLALINTNYGGDDLLTCGPEVQCN